MLEDKTRIRDYKINANLATLRCCLLKLKAQLLAEFSWPEIIERAQLDNPSLTNSSQIKGSNKDTLMDYLVVTEKALFDNSVPNQIYE